MNRALLLVATAFLGAMGCRSNRCDTDISFFWHFPDATGTTELACAQAGVAFVEIFEDGFSDGQFDCTLLDRNNNPVQGITLLNFDVREYQFRLDGLDANGNLLYTDSFAFTPTACVDNQIDRDLIPLTGTLSMFTSFNSITTCAAAGVENYFLEVLDPFNNPVPGANGVFVPCVDQPGSLPGFTIPDLVFGGTYTFRTLAGTTFDPSVPGSNQRVVYQRCGAAVNFTAATPTFQLDIPLAAPGAVCP